MRFQFHLTTALHQSFVSKGEPLRVLDVISLLKRFCFADLPIMKISFLLMQPKSLFCWHFILIPIYLKRNTVVFFTIPLSGILICIRNSVSSYLSPGVYLYIGLYLSFSFVTFSIACAAWVCNRQSSRSILALFVQNIELFLQFFRMYLQEENICVILNLLGR